jgi:hypothetical protein
LKNNLYVSEDGNNRVFLVNDGIKAFCQQDKRGLLRKINLGTRAFQRCRNKHNGQNIVFRITQEGLQALFPVFTKRKYRVSLDTLMYLVHNMNIKTPDVPKDNQDLQAILKDPLLGYFCIYVECSSTPGKILEVASLLKFNASIILMASDEQVQEFKIKYSKDFIDVPTKGGHPPTATKNIEQLVDEVEDAA